MWGGTEPNMKAEAILLYASAVHFLIVRETMHEAQTFKKAKGKRTPGQYEQTTGETKFKSVHT